MQQETLIQRLRAGLSTEELGTVEADLARFEAASEGLGFADLGRELPPAARYIGPGAWLDAIAESWSEGERQ